MNCEQSQERMIDVLYGEELSPRLCYQFFGHLERCESCNREYLEMLEIREDLSEWEVDPQQVNSPAAVPVSGWTGVLGKVRWWSVIPRIAAGFLIVFGMVAILQSMGFWGGRKLLVNQGQLTALISDMMVEQQAEERDLMLRALLEVKEDIELDQREADEQLQLYVLSLEQRYLENLEDNNQYLETILSR